MRIEVGEEERQLLLDLLDELLGDLRDEIYRAESHQFKEQLKAEQSKGKVLDRKFQEGLKKAKDLPGKPINPMELD